MVKRSRNMGVHLNPLDATDLSKVLAQNYGWGRWWAVWEYPWLCSTPDDPNSRGTLDVTDPTDGHAAMRFAGLHTIAPMLGVPKYVNVRSDGTDGGRHRFAVTAQGRARFAADAVVIASALDPAWDIFEIWNEPNIMDFSRDQNYLGGAESTATVFAQMVSETVATVRAFFPTLPIMLGSIAGRGDMNNQADVTEGYVGNVYGLAVIDWIAQNAPQNMPDLCGFHPYGFSGGATQDNNPADMNRGWNGHAQALRMHQGMVTRGCPKRDALLGTGTGYQRMSAKLLITEYGAPSEPETDGFTESWQATHAVADLQTIIWQQALGVYHPVAIDFNNRDHTNPGDGIWGNHYGYNYRDWSPKAAAAVYALFGSIELNPTVDDPNPDPTDPPPVPLVPRPRSYWSRITGPPTVYGVRGSGLITGGQDAERLYTRDEQHSRLNSVRGVVCLAGVGGAVAICSPHLAIDPFTRQLYHAIRFCLSARPGQADGYTFLGTAPYGTAQWGNDNALAALEVDIAAFQGNGQMGGAKAGKVAFIGVSMGHVTALNYTVRNPSQVAGVFACVPECDLTYAYNGGTENWVVGGFPSLINAAYGLPTSPNAIALDATVKAERDPLTRAAEVADVPWGLSWNANDPLVPAYTVESFIEAKGGPDAFNLLRRNDDGGHHQFNITGPQLLELLDSFAW